MDKQSRTLLWEKMSKQYVATEDLQTYSLDELKKLEDRLNNFVEKISPTIQFRTREFYENFS